jgi:D-arabinose 1-dehydrogenase-like Zn-dependent alcohol dehydrogenase
MDYVLQKFGGSMHYIMLNAKTVAALTKKNNKRVICTLNNTATLHCALMHKKEGGHFIVIGTAVCKKLKIKAGATVSASFIIDTTAYQFKMPEELQEVLDTDHEAQKIFAALTPGNQRGLIYLVTLLKLTDKRIERALLVAKKIKAGIIVPRLVLKK